MVSARKAMTDGLMIRRLMRDREKRNRVRRLSPAAGLNMRGRSVDRERSCPRSLGSSNVRRGYLPEEFDFTQGAASAFGDCAQRILGHVDREAGLFRQQTIQTAEESASSREHETAVHEIC